MLYSFACKIVPKSFGHIHQNEQVAQLSHRDRAAGWVSFG